MSIKNKGNRLAPPRDRWVCRWARPGDTADRKATLSTPRPGSPLGVAATPSIMSYG